MVEIDNIEETIERRRSLRSYNGLKLDKELNKRVQEAITQAEPLFADGERPVIRLVDASLNGRLGTYGVIQGAREYLLAYCDDTLKAKMNVGFMLEQVVLKCAELGLGTCWMGGTFRQAAFAAAGEGVPDNFTLQIVSPVGHPTPRLRFFERVSRRIAGSDRRKPFEQLFELPEGKADSAFLEKIRQCLEAVRLAPSSVNSQPWRARVFADEKVKFWPKDSSRFTPIDMGIAYCHFLLTAQSLGLGGFLSADGDKPLPSMNFLG